MRRTLVCAGLAALGLLAWATAAAAGERVRVEWSSAVPTQTWAPYVSVVYPDVQYKPGARWAGPCASPFTVCSLPSEHWEESELNASGHPRVIKLVDDRPDLARRLCVVVEHPFVADFPIIGGLITGTLTLTGFDGVARSIPFAIDKGQKTGEECSPPQPPEPPAGPRAGPFEIDPPAWWREGQQVIERRGGVCTTQRWPDDTHGGTFDSRVCSVKIPKAIGVAFGGNPAADAFSETCDATATQNRRPSDEWYYNCRIYAFPGTSAKPNVETWRCFREAYFSPGYGPYVDAWSTQALRRSKWPRRRVQSLQECLSPRAVARGAARRGRLRVSVKCSHACTARITALRNGKRVGSARRSLAAWRETKIRVAIAGRSRGVTYRLDVRAGKRRGIAASGRDVDVFLR